MGVIADDQEKGSIHSEEAGPAKDPHRLRKSGKIGTDIMHTIGNSGSIGRFARIT
jgi:hypothetical protein